MAAQCVVTEDISGTVTDVHCDSQVPVQGSFLISGVDAQATVDLSSVRFFSRSQPLRYLRLRDAYLPASD